MKFKVEPVTIVVAFTIIGLIWGYNYVIDDLERHFGKTTKTEISQKIS